MGNGVVNNDRVQFAVTGDVALSRLLSELPRAAEKRAIRAAILAATRPIMWAIKANAPQESRTLRKSIGRKLKTYKSGVVVGIVGARRAITGEYRGRRRVPANYIHLVEGGTRPHAMGKGSSLKKRIDTGGPRHPGTKPTRFMAQAWRAQMPAAIAAATRKMTEAINREARKLAKAA